MLGIGWLGCSTRRDMSLPLNKLMPHAGSAEESRREQCAAFRDNYVGNSSPKLGVGNVLFELRLYYLILIKSL